MRRCGENIAKYLQQELPGLIAVYMFGSAARDELCATSDVDIAILPEAPLEPMRRFELQEDLAQIVGCDVDLIDLLSVSTVMRMQVVPDGLLLFDSDAAARIRFENYCFSSYARLNEERHAILETVKAEKRIHGG